MPPLADRGMGIAEYPHRVPVSSQVRPSSIPIALRACEVRQDGGWPYDIYEVALLSNVGGVERRTIIGGHRYIVQSLQGHLLSLEVREGMADIYLV